MTIVKIEKSEIDQTNLKTIKNWKLVQVSKQDKVCIVGYDKNNDRNGQSTPIDAVYVSPNPDYLCFRTESGSFYLQKRSEQNGSPWSMGLQIKRPMVHSNLIQLGVF